MKEKTDVLQGTLALMVLKTLDVLGPQHGYGTPNPPLRSVRFFEVRAEDLS
jgi:hypothetical protein